MILDDTFQEGNEIKLVEASKGKRFVNYLIDSVVLQVISYLLNAAAGVTEENADPVYSIFVWFGIYLAYYIIFENFNNGITVGKILTRTQVVSINGGKPTTEHIMGRSLARIIPFDALSYLGERKNGWHDRLSKTIVIDIDQSERPFEAYI
jgi:uncharacterized RDD family membrane protein YckC